MIELYVLDPRVEVSFVMAEVLIVDDEQMVRALLRRFLKQAGHTVTEAEDGLAALAQLRRLPFDLVMLDIFMPQAEGIETLLAIRSAGYDVPVVAMSGRQRGREEADFLMYATKLGADEMLRKPFTKTEVLCLVAQLLGTDATSR
jgi:CheY-like chemotaxis protein